MRAFVYTNADRDGALEGPDLDEVGASPQVVRGRFLYSGGIGSLEDLVALRELRQVNLVGRDRRQGALRGPLHAWPRRRRRRSAGSIVHYKRVIPCMDVDAGRVVKGTRFIDIRDAGDPVELAAHYDREGADELVFLDITATSDKRATVVELARRAADEVFVPFTIGGGVREVADAQAVLDAGADKVSVNSAAVARAGADRRAGARVRRPVRRARDRRQARRRRAGRSTWPAGARRPAATPSSGRARASSAARGRSCSPRWTATAPRTATTSSCCAAISGAVDVPVIASGGAGEPEHLVEGLSAGADAALCASIFHYGRYTIAEVKDRLAAAGVPRQRAMTGRRAGSWRARFSA